MKTDVEAIERAVNQARERFVSIKEECAKQTHNDQMVDEIETGLIWVAKKVEKLKEAVSEPQ